MVKIVRLREIEKVAQKLHSSTSQFLGTNKDTNTQNQLTQNYPQNEQNPTTVM